MKTKICGKCKQTKSSDFFSKNSSRKDGLADWCKLCSKQCNKIYRQKNKEKVKAINKAWYVDNQDKVKAYCIKNEEKIKKNRIEYNKKNKNKTAIYNKNYRIENKESIQVYSKQYSEDNKDKLRLCAKKYAELNKEVIAANKKISSRKYYLNNIDTVKENQKKYNKEHRKEINLNEREKFKNNVTLRLSHNVTTLMNLSLRGNKNGWHWETLINYTLQDLIAHLEKQFVGIMSWDNYGRTGWHIDHILARSLFKYDSYEDREFKQCFALCNLQPLWASDNIRKGNKCI